MRSLRSASIEAVEDVVRRSFPFRRWLRSRRWCGENLGLGSELSVKQRVVLRESGREALVLFLVSAKEPGGSRLLNLPLSISEVRQDPESFEIRLPEASLYLVEAERREVFARFLADGFRGRPRLDTEASDRLVFRGSSLGAYRTMIPWEAQDTSNLILRIVTDVQDAIFKSYKILNLRNREPRILERLHRRKFPYVADFLGEVALDLGGEDLVLGVASKRVDAVDLFDAFRSAWKTLTPGRSTATAEVVEGSTLSIASGLGEATAALHDALTDRHPGPFHVEPFRRKDAGLHFRSAVKDLGDSLRALGRMAKHPDPSLADMARDARGLLLTRRAEIEATLRGIDSTVGTMKGVTHGDLHLAQVLREGGTGSLYFVDFEGEPDRPPGARSEKQPPIRDVAAMNRSFSYVAHYVWRDASGSDARTHLRRFGATAGGVRDDDVAPRVFSWQRAMQDRYTRAYFARSAGYTDLSPDERRRALAGWALEKALYELRYETAHRPENVPIPVEGILSLVSKDV